jgi:hypothetical protein
MAEDITRERERQREKEKAKLERKPNLSFYQNVEKKKKFHYKN